MAPSCLHARWPGLDLARVPLGSAPTPVRRLVLDGIDPAVDLWAKAEDSFGGEAWGGNKVRKLEWIIPEAQRRGVRTIFTVGGIGTHWGLACARYAGEHGLHTALGLVDQPVDEHVRLQLARLEASPATLHRLTTPRRLLAAAPLLMARHAFGGGRPRLPWYVPAGGSNPFGTLAYVDVALEIAAQVDAGEIPAPGTMVVAVGSGGTAAGLALGLRIAGLAPRLLAVVVNDSLRLDAPTLARLANATGDLLRRRGATNVPSVGREAFGVRRDWLGATYGDPTMESVAMVAAASRAGLELEPVYTGKALAAIADLSTTLPGPVLWLNTHGPRPDRPGSP